jgi:CheY-like chemotaxis protein
MLSVEVGVGQLEFKITDSGIGMNEDQLRKIFKPFQQADASITRKFGGTGLGLSITKSLIELIGGTIHVESEVGKGTIFTVKLNVDNYLNENYNTYKSDDLKLELSEKVKVLVAEDNKINQKVISKILEKLNLEYTIVENGKLALEYRKKEDFDLVFMDMQMPLMDGLSATREIRSYEKQNNASPVKIVALTANAFEEDKKSCYEAGMNEYLSKPVKRRDVIKVINKLFG